MKKTYVTLDKAREVAADLSLALATHGAERTEIVGSIRRSEASIGDVDAIVVLPTWEGLSALVERAGVEVSEGGDTRVFGHYKGLVVNVWRADREAWGAALFALTGPQKYVIGYRMKAKRAGLLLNEHGLWQGDRRIAGATEEEIYRALGKEWKRPDLRGK